MKTKLTSSGLLQGPHGVALVASVAAGLLGTRRAVWLGGAVTLAVVALTGICAPKLRRLNLTRDSAKENSG